MNLFFKEKWFNSGHAGLFFMLFLLSADFFQHDLFQKNISRKLSECQNGLWVFTVCHLAISSIERVKCNWMLFV